MTSLSQWNVNFSPYLPLSWLAVLLGLCLLPILWGIFRRAGGSWWRLMVWAILAVFFMNPKLQAIDAEPLTQIIVVAVDRSASNTLAGRDQRTNRALKSIEDQAKAHYGPQANAFEMRVVDIMGGPDGTDLMAQLDAVLAHIPPSRLAGVIALSDGAVKSGGNLPAAPFNLVLTSAKSDFDRRLEVTQAPKFSLVGQTMVFRVKLHDPGTKPVPADLSLNGTPVIQTMLPPGVDHEFELSIQTAGPNLIEIQTPILAGELTPLNNHAYVSVTGIRDRLRVLLISGEPHMGLRMWRNLLKSDPAVDLVHFTILRPPEKDDYTPLNELSLIVFPVRELFEERLNDFDLVIFDRYRRRSVLSPAYLENLSRYVTQGGAMLIAVGDEYADQPNLWDSALAEILPASPSGLVEQGPFKPKLSPLGIRHPITRDLNSVHMGQWQSVIGASDLSGMILMEKPNAGPLLLVDRRGLGRVGMIMSEDLWMWARGMDGGGPWEDLTRRLAHWLMKEPELEEERLSAMVEDGKLVVKRQTMDAHGRNLNITHPDGSHKPLWLAEAQNGLQTGELTLNVPGIYTIDDDRTKVQVAFGALEMKEYLTPLGGPEILSPLINATGGALAWAEDSPRLVFTKNQKTDAKTAPLRPSREVRLHQKQDHWIKGLREIPLFPGFIFALLALGGLAIAWWRESR